jgi:GNAT superfamily N-acetyltransferase
MPPLRSRMVDGSYKLLGSVLRLANGFPSLGFGMTWACPYSYQLSLAHDDWSNPRGVLKDGRPYEMTYKDVTNPEEKAKGIIHYYISCRSDGEELGHVRALHDTIYIEELDRVVRFNGWYLYDAYVEPQARRMGIIRKGTRYCLYLAKGSGTEDQYAFALTQIYNRPSRQALESMGFTRNSNVLYVKILGQQRWLGMDNGRIG